MINIAGRWNGHVYGTNTGNLHLEIEQTGEDVAGTLRLSDTQFGINVYSIEGKATDQGIELSFTPTEISEGVQPGPGKIVATIAPDGSLQGTWESEIGSAGTFRAYRHLLDNSIAAEEPPQLFNRTLSVGSVRMFRTDVERLIDELLKDFVVGRPVVTYLLHGNEVSEYADTFLARTDIPDRLENLKITIQELEPNGRYNMAAAAELYRSGGNVIRTSGTSESWVLGKGTALLNQIRGSEKKLFSAYLKYGLNLNLLLFLLLLVLLPELDLPGRTIYSVSMVGLLWLLYSIHNRFIPHTVINMGPTRPGWVARIRDQAVSWLLAVSSAFIASWLFWYLIQKGNE